MFNARQFVTVGLLTLALLGLAELAARQQAPGGVVPVEQGVDCPPGVHDLNYFRVVNTIAVTYFLVAPALCLFAYRKAGEPMGAWLAFWTFAYAAYVVHLYWAIAGMMGGRTELIFRCKNLVEHPYNDTALTIAWGLDVLLAWLVVATTGDIWKSPPWIRAWRGLVHFWLFAALVLVWVTKAENWYVRGVGLAMTVAVLLSAGARIVIKPFDAGSLTGRLYIGAFRVINTFVPWHRLPTWLAVMNLGAFRETLRAQNLVNTSDIPVTNPQNRSPIPPFDPRYVTQREDDGYYDDLGKPSMGSASINTVSQPPAGSSMQAAYDSMYFNKSQPGARFGRNVPLDQVFPDESNLLNPSPRLISNELLARDTFKPATILNLLAAAWIQFETHDWFNHGEPPSEKESIDPYKVALPDGDQWHECPMRIRPTRPDPTRDYEEERRRHDGRLADPPSYANAESHWWDGSQIYGSNPETTLRLRSDYQKDADGRPILDEHGHHIPTDMLLDDGKLALTHEQLSLDPGTGAALAGFTGNWWIGLTLLHTLFTREHNAICDRLRHEYATWSGDRIFEVARLVNAALMAKIHTIEWTPAILSHPALQVAMDANWWGLLTERVKKLCGRISQNEAFSGIPGSGVDHTGADYCLTEEFVSVYRMHPLIPDELKVYSARDGSLLKQFRFPSGIVGYQKDLQTPGDGVTMADLFYSFGLANPGAITLHNYPDFLRRLQRFDGEIVDVASIDILRDRERGVPRYNRFRRLLHRPPIQSFDDFNNPSFPTLAQDLRRIYGTMPDGRDNVELLDLMVGLYAEVPPVGFGFSDTAFRIFILMASRRLKSDRFIAADFVPEVYTQVGLDWVENTTMSDILLRHYPELRPALYGVNNAFAPWRRVEENPGAVTAAGTSAAAGSAGVSRK
jgi:hypothetical protein